MVSPGGSVEAGNDGVLDRGWQGKLLFHSTWKGQRISFKIVSIPDAALAEMEGPQNSNSMIIR
jgi:hypothetical protein